MSKIDKLNNVITAMISPFDDNLIIDEMKYREFIRFQIEIQDLTSNLKVPFLRQKF